MASQPSLRGISFNRAILSSLLVVGVSVLFAIKYGDEWMLAVVACLCVFLLDRWGLPPIRVYLTKAVGGWRHRG